MSQIRFLRTANFRLTALYAALFAASSVVIFGIFYWIVTDTLQQQMTMMISAEISVLEQEYSAGRETELTQEIGQRISSGQHPFSFYLLQDQNGRKLTGNLPAMTPFEGWQEIPAPFPLVTEISGDPTEIRDQKAFVRGKLLDGGAFMVVGASTYHGDESREAIRRAFFWAMGVSLVLAIGGGVVLSLGFLRRIDDINRTVQAIVEGQLSERIWTSGTNDELDLLAVNLNKMLDRIQSLMQSLQQVSNNIAHDLRRPLGRLRQHLEGARRDANSINAYKIAVNKAIIESDEVLTTFGSLLRIAQIEAKTRSYFFRPVNLSQIFQNVVETYVPVGEDVDKKLEADIAPGIVIDGDQELLTQQLVNLVENSLTHTLYGTLIRLSLFPSPQGPVGIISDDGPGIAESDREQIFERFYRLDTSRSTPGNGLGLALVKAVADLHGSTVIVTDNHPGAIFTIHFKSIHPDYPDQQCGPIIPAGSTA